MEAEIRIAVVAFDTRGVSAAALGGALRTVGTDASMRVRARALGARIRTEDGVASAVAVYDRSANHLP